MENQTTTVHSPRRSRPSIFFPLLLVTAGVILLLHTINVLPGTAWGTILRYWPVLLITSALDSLYRGEGYVGAVIWGGLGIFLLLNNLGVIPSASWTMLLRWWPVLLIAAGLDLIIGRNSLWSAIIGILVGIIILAGIVWLSTAFTPAPSPQAQTLAWEKQSADNLTARLSLSAGEVQVSSGAAGDQAVSAALTLGGSTELQDSYAVRQGQAYFELESQSMFVFYPALQSPAAQTLWKVYFNPDLPLDLTSNLIAGEQQLNLNDLNLTYLNSQTIFGRTTMWLPEEGPFKGEAEVIFGELLVYVPEDAAVRIYADTGLTGVALPEGYTREDDLIRSPAPTEGAPALELNLKQPIGSLRIVYY